MMKCIFKYLVLLVIVSLAPMQSTGVTVTSGTTQSSSESTLSPGSMTQQVTMLMETATTGQSMTGQTAITGTESDNSTGQSTTGKTTITGTESDNSTDQSPAEQTTIVGTESVNSTGQSTTGQTTITVTESSTATGQSTMGQTTNGRNEPEQTGSSMSTAQSTTMETSPDQSSATQMTTDSKGKGGLSTMEIAIIGGVSGGVVVVVVVMIFIVYFCKSEGTVITVTEDGVSRREKKKKNTGGSGKDRHSILSWRHKVPLFSAPFDNTTGDSGTIRNTAFAEDTDTNAMIMEYRPKSKIASQIRVNLDADNDELGTIENGFVPAFITEEEEDYGHGGVVEGRLGIIGTGTFAPAVEASVDKAIEKQETQKDTDREGDEGEVENVNELYSKTTKRNTPGDTAFDNALYDPFHSGSHTVASVDASDSVAAATDAPDSVAAATDAPASIPKTNADVGKDDCNMGEAVDDVDKGDGGERENEKSVTPNEDPENNIANDDE